MKHDSLLAGFGFVIVAFLLLIRPASADILYKVYYYQMDKVAFTAKIKANKDTAESIKKRLAVIEHLKKNFYIPAGSDLRGVDLSNLTFHGQPFMEVNLENADLTNITCPKCTFLGANLKNVKR